jgi:hypothetical protein
VLSIGSSGSILSIGSAGSILSIGGAGTFMNRTDPKDAAKVGTVLAVAGLLATLAPAPTRS